MDIIRFARSLKLLELIELLAIFLATFSIIIGGGIGCFVALKVLLS